MVEARIRGAACRRRSILISTSKRLEREPHALRHRRWICDKASAATRAKNLEQISGLWIRSALFSGKWLQTRIRGSRHKYLASPPFVHISACFALLSMCTRPILRDHVCVRVAAIQISPLRSSETNTVRSRHEPWTVSSTSPTRCSYSRSFKTFGSSFNTCYSIVTFVLKLLP